MEFEVKKLLVIMTSLSLAAPAFADTTTTDVKQKSLYLKLSAGASKLNKAEEKNSSQDIHIKSNISKSEISPAFTISFGGYINDVIRTEIAFDYLNVTFKDNTINSGNIVQSYQDGQAIMNANSCVKRKAAVYSTMLNSYIDLPVTENVKLFVGGGIGIAKIKEKLEQTWSGDVTSYDYEGNKLGHEKYREKNSSASRKKINFAYTLTIGTSFTVTPIVNLEIAYNWKDFGKTKYKKVNDVTKNHYRGHVLMTGLRVDL
jgi:opacity protein-like surface antigen